VRITVRIILARPSGGQAILPVGTREGWQYLQ
jgi:hypothetical protein